MYKYVISFVLSQMIFLAQAAPTNSFEKLAPAVNEHASRWADEVVVSLEDDLQLVFLNLFALNSEEVVKAFMKCAEHIEQQPSMLPFYEKMVMHIMDILRKYVENVQEKIKLKENISEKEKKAIDKKLEIKIQELISYINSVYYEKLYTRITQKNTISPMYMFDEKGIITREKRTRALPQTL